jgi:hypothetical protein
MAQVVTSVVANASETIDTGCYKKGNHNGLGLGDDGFSLMWVFAAFCCFFLLLLSSTSDRT